MDNTPNFNTTFVNTELHIFLTDTIVTFWYSSFSINGYFPAFPNNKDITYYANAK